MTELFSKSASDQSEMPFALIQGEPLAVIPQDLYIPPDALLIFLEAFEGPLDLLLYMIKRQNIDILNIPVATITRQYMEYINLMNELQLELAAEYLVMAAMLAEIKSRLLLPRPAESLEEDDPRAELMRRLQEYEQFKKAAEDIDALDRLERDIHLPQIEIPQIEIKMPLPEVEIGALLNAFRDVVNRAEQFASHHVDREPLSVRERMVIVLDKISAEKFTSFGDFFEPGEGRMGVVVSFLAILELLRESLIELVQSEPYAPIYVKATA
ncbi:MAG: segregation/condensation protein A [Proteobacteria bacterium]|nr:segregation/condensation protein A [Pseudomonadota bacterium]MCH8177026.1 segregation/condensation protein A [Pseudomonadota bacterium]